MNAVDSASLSTNAIGDIEPPDQGLCAGNKFVVESDNIGEVLVFNQALGRASSVIPLNTMMGLNGLGWSSGGDVSCVFDPSNGGHWFFTQIVSASTEASGGPFSGCFNAVANTCYEGIAVTSGASPFGPYNVYFQNANYNPAEPGAPYLLNDFAKIGTTRDAFLDFYDEFPLNGNNPGVGGGFFNGAQEFAFNKTALELGLPTTLSGGAPNPAFTVAIENMSNIATPDGTCAATKGGACWYQVIPAQPAASSSWDNQQGGTGFMFGSLDFFGSGDTRVAAFDWTGLHNLVSSGCSSCSGLHFGGQLLSGVEFYRGVGTLAAQKAGPIPLGDECGAAGLSVGNPPPASCPEGGLETSGDGAYAVTQAQGQLWTAVPTEVAQTFSSESSPEVHQAAAFWVIGTKSFDKGGPFSLTSQGYVSAAHEDIEFPTIAATPVDQNAQGSPAKAIMSFTLSGNGGPTGADNGGYFPTSAYGWLTSTSGDLSGSLIRIVDLGQSPQDGFTEYQGFPGPLRPRWGDYGAAVFGNGRLYFASEYIQFPNCSGADFTLTIGTCGGTRDGFANWGTSVNSVTP